MSLFTELEMKNSILFDMVRDLIYIKHCTKDLPDQRPPSKLSTKAFFNRQSKQATMAEQPISFLTVVSRPDFTHLLRFPSAFVRKYGSIFPKNVKIRTESGRSWDVEVETTENGRFWFSNGWSNFAQEVGLNLGETLVFVLKDDGFTLDVFVLGSNGCEREIQFPVTISDDDDEDEADDDEEDESGTAQTKPRNDGRGKSWVVNPLYYEITLKRHHQSRVTLKSRFSNAAGFVEKRRVTVVGKHATNLVELDHKIGNRVDMAKGWPNFRVANALAYDKTYSLEFKPSEKAIYVKEVKTRN